MTTDWYDVLLIMGDINIDLLPHYHATRTVQYKNMLNCFNLHEHVQRPTRVIRHRYLRLTIQGNMTIIDQLLYPTYPCSPFYLHSILILALLFSQNSERMQVVYTFCSPSAKTSPLTSIRLVVTVWIH